MAEPRIYPHGGLFGWALTEAMPSRAPQSTSYGPVGIVPSVLTSAVRLGIRRG